MAGFNPNVRVEAKLLTRKDTLDALKAQNIKIPDLQPLFQHWPQVEVHPDVEQLRSLVHDRLESLYASVTKVAALDTHDFGFFGACAWPATTAQVAQNLTLMATWLFLWDDEINDEVGSLQNEIIQAQKLRAKTTMYMKSHLGEGYKAEQGQKLPLRVLSLFEPVEGEVRRCYPQKLKDTLLKEIEFYIETSDLEQMRRRNPMLPSQVDYTASRMGSSGVTIFLAFNEYATGTTLPAKIMESNHMKVIWEETNRIVWVTNDVLSLKKELKHDVIDSLVPILFQRNGNLHEAADECVEIIKHSIGLFDHAAGKLLEECEDDVKARDDLQGYLKVCRDYCTGILHWSLQTGRYSVEKGVTSDDVGLECSHTLLGSPDLSVGFQEVRATTSCKIARSTSLDLQYRGTDPKRARTL